MHVQAAMPHAGDDGAGRRGLTGFHTGAGERDDRHAVRIEFGVRIELLVADARRHADALTEIRELQHDADDARVERPALLGIRGIAHAEHAADVQHLNDVAFLDRLRQVARVAEQRLTVTERADDDVALRHLRHAAAGQLERVVRRLVVEDLDNQHDAFLARNVRGGDAQFTSQVQRLGDRGDLVDDDGFHFGTTAMK
jgi:hypothetical protein